MNLLFIKMNHRVRALILTISMVLLGVIGYIDFATGYEISVDVFYLIPLLLIGWYFKRISGIVYSIICSALVAVIHINTFNHYSSVWIYAWNHLGIFIMYVTFAVLISELKKLLLIESEYSRKDGLTGLANLRFLYEFLGREIEHARRHGHSLASIYIDCDNFKEINDTFGHEAGNRLLVTIADVLLSCLRVTDVIARLGGDEFCAILRETSREDCMEVAKKLKQSLDQAMNQGGWPVTFSIGIAHFSVMPENPDAVVKLADTAMYESKKNGKDKISMKILE